MVGRCCCRTRGDGGGSGRCLLVMGIAMEFQLFGRPHWHRRADRGASPPVHEPGLDQMHTNLCMIRELNRGIKSPSLEELWQRDARRRQRSSANLLSWFASTARELGRDATSQGAESQDSARWDLRSGWTRSSLAFALVVAAGILLFLGFT